MSGSDSGAGEMRGERFDSLKCAANFFFSCRLTFFFFWLRLCSLASRAARTTQIKKTRLAERGEATLRSTSSSAQISPSPGNVTFREVFRDSYTAIES